MKVWIKVGSFKPTQISIDRNSLFIDDLKSAIKEGTKPYFDGVAVFAIVVRGQDNSELDPEVPLVSLPLGDTSANAFSVDPVPPGKTEIFILMNIITLILIC
jgi:hypothetical protein